MNSNYTSPAYTAGPWHLNPDLEIWQWENEPSKRGNEAHIASIVDDELTIFNERTANGRLIAAAPELLACLKEAYEWHKDDQGVEPEEGETGNALQHWIDAIAKAEGK